MKNKITKIELHFNFHNRFLRDYDFDLEHKKYYCVDYLKISDQKLINGRELYTTFFICQEEVIENHKVNKFTGYTSPVLNTPNFSKCFTETIKDKLENHFLYLDFSLFDRFKNTSNVSGMVSITKENDFFIMACEFVSMEPFPLKRVDIKFMFNNNVGLARAVNKLSMLNANLVECDYGFR